MGRPAKEAGEKKKPVGIKLAQADIDLLAACCEATGMKVNTIIEQGLRLRIEQLAKQLNGGKPFPSIEAS